VLRTPSNTRSRSQCHGAKTAFALKGGTAINLFLHDMPRLSIHIDLTYLPAADRESSLKEIDAAVGS
jgi:hypothetical protein